MILNVRRIINRNIPIVEWLPHYDVEKGISDFVAGITVGLTLIPQSLAYAGLAGLSPEYGLYSSLCGGFIYTIFGTVPQINIAPTALLSLLTYSYTHNASFGAVPATILLCLTSGIVELICGILHLGFLLDFVSTPVIAGFTSAGAVTIASAQVKNLLGLNFTAEHFVDVWINVVKQYKEVKQWDSILSLCCCVTLLILRQIKVFGTPPISSSEKEDAKKRNWCRIFIWFLSVSRNALIVIGCAVATFVLSLYDLEPFSLTTQVPSGLPNASLPAFEIQNANSTFTLIDMLQELGAGIPLVAFVAILGNVAIAKAFAQGKMVDASQEMVAVGLCNVVSSCFSSMPVNASFSRAAVSNASGIRTAIGGIYTGIMVLLSLTFLTPYFVYIPKATLASVIVCAVIFMIEVSIIKPIWQHNKIDWIPLWGTFCACLYLGIELGILIGIAIDVVLLLYYSARPTVTTKIISVNGVDYLQITPSSSILFPSSYYLRNAIIKFNEDLGKTSNFVVLNCCQINKIDFTSGQSIIMLANDLNKSNKILVLLKAGSKLRKIFENSDFVAAKFATSEDNLKDIFSRTEA